MSPRRRISHLVTISMASSAYPPSLTLWAAPSRVSYPDLPKLSSAERQIASRPFKHSPPKRQQVAHNAEPWGLHTSTTSFSGVVKSPPNSGRRRVPPKLSNALANSPPRPSYADKVKGIFAESAAISKKPRFLDPEHHKAVSTSSAYNIKPQTDSNTSSSSALTSESELERRLNARHNSPDAILPRSIQPMPPPMPYPAPVHNTVTFSNINIAHVQEPVPESTSSDEWTGDEEFLPRAARRQIRMLRQQRRPKEGKEASQSCHAPSPQLLRAVAANDREIRNHLIGMNPIRSPTSSRFRPAGPFHAPSRRWEMPVSIGRADQSYAAKLQCHDGRQPADHRSSDADDEADSDA